MTDGVLASMFAFEFEGATFRFLNSWRNLCNIMLPPVVTSHSYRHDVGVHQRWTKILDTILSQYYAAEDLRAMQTKFFICTWNQYMLKLSELESL